MNSYSLHFSSYEKRKKFIEDISRFSVRIIESIEECSLAITWKEDVLHPDRIKFKILEYYIGHEFDEWVENWH